MKEKKDSAQPLAPKKEKKGGKVRRDVDPACAGRPRKKEKKALQK